MALSVRALARKARRAAVSRQREQARERAEEALRGGFDAAPHVLARLGPGDLAAYNARRKETC